MEKVQEKQDRKCCSANNSMTNKTNLHPVPSRQMVQVYRWLKLPWDLCVWKKKTCFKKPKTKADIFIPYIQTFVWILKINRKIENIL